MSPRRGRGEGSIQQRHDHKTCPPVIDGIRADHTCKGRWAKVIDHGWQNGTRKRTYIYGNTKKELQEKVAQHKGGISSEWTVASWMNHWLDEVAAIEVRPQTLQSYRAKTRAYIIPLLGKHRLDQLTGEHVEAMLKRMRQKCPRPDEDGNCAHTPSHGLSESTLRQTHAILARALKIAVRRKHVDDNAARMIDAPATKTAIRQRLTVAEAKQVLATAAGDDYEARWWCALMLGMRQGECLGLSWAMVNFQEGTITIARTLTPIAGGGVAFGAPKSDSSKRTIPMPAIVNVKLAEHFARYLETQDGDPDMSALVWTLPNGNPIRHKVDYRRWKALLGAAGVPDVALHSARQTALAMMEEAGIQARVAAEISGHSDVKQLYGYQRDAGLENRRKAIAAIETAWDKDD